MTMPPLAGLITQVHEIVASLMPEVAVDVAAAMQADPSDLHALDVLTERAEQAGPMYVLTLLRFAAGLATVAGMTPLQVELIGSPAAEIWPPKGA